MKYTKWYGVAVALLLGSGVAVAASSDTDEKIDQLNAETQQLQKEVNDLKTQLSQVKSRPAASSSSSTDYIKQSSEAGYSLPDQPAGAEYFGPERYARGVTITTSPWMGLRSASDTYDLLYSQSSMNEDVMLLQERQYMQHMLESVGDTLDNRALVSVSGGVEGQLLVNRNYDHTSGDDIALSTVELDFSAFASRWANLFMSLDYDDSSPATGNRVSNSNLYLSRGFLTLGNLDEVPVYFTIGQMYAPFGRYATALWTMTPVTTSLARIEGRVASLGYAKNGLYASAYGFQGSRTSGSDSLPKQGGLNIGYQQGGFDIGAGYVSNIADSQGMQSNGLSTVDSEGSDQFVGFGESATTDALVHNVPAVDLHLEYTLNKFTLIGEYIAAVERFDPADLTYDGAGAKVSALHSELDYATEIFGKPVVFGGVYERTEQSLALNLPKDSYMAVMDISLWKGTIQALEYRHDVNYGQTAGSSTSGSGMSVGDANVGGTRNMVSLLFGVYF